MTRPTYRGTPTKDILDVKTILVVAEDGTPRELEQISPVFSAMGQQTRVYISCYAKVAGGTVAARNAERVRIGVAAENVIDGIAG
jgi:hypothetical protein